MLDERVFMRNQRRLIDMLNTRLSRTRLPVRFILPGDKDFYAIGGFEESLVRVKEGTLTINSEDEYAQRSVIVLLERSRI